MYAGLMFDPFQLLESQCIYRVDMFAFLATFGGT